MSIYGSGGANAELNFSTSPLRPGIAAVVEPKICEKCSRPFLRFARPLQAHRDRECPRCRRVAKPAVSVMPGFGRGNVRELRG